ncbi:MAG: proton-conducting transporter membrane subunit, partial [Prochlorococcus sp.]
PFFAELTSDTLFLVAIISLFKVTGSFGFDENISTLQAIVASGSLTALSLLLPCALIFLSLIAKLSILPLSVFRVGGKMAIPSTSGVIQSLMLVSAIVFLSWRIEPLVVVASQTLNQTS